MAEQLRLKLPGEPNPFLGRIRGRRGPPGEGQLAFAMPVDPSQRLEDFVEGASNEEAIATLAAFPDWADPVLVLHGPEGAGKTHLLRIFAEANGGRMVRADAPVAMLRAAFEGAGPAIVEDADRGFPDEAAMFHLVNRVRVEGGALVLSARAPAIAWPVATRDLASRLRLAPAVGIGAPDDALLEALLGKLLSDRGIPAPAALLAYLAGRIERSFSAASRIVERLDAASLARRRRISVPFARAVLEDLAEDEGGEE
jgi:chromosomal replication initiation ATPase DnaA